MDRLGWHKQIDWLILTRQKHWRRGICRQLRKDTCSCGRILRPPSWRKAVPTHPSSLPRIPCKPPGSLVVSNLVSQQGLELLVGCFSQDVKFDGGFAGLFELGVHLLPRFV